MNEEHNYNDYDKSAIAFSPEGRLHQVEYARECIAKGSTTIGVRTKNGIALVAEKVQSNTLMVAESFKKIFLIDDHIGIGVAGLISDAQVLIDIARIEAQRNFASYDEAIDVDTLTKKICAYKQSYTQYSGMRPFGATLLIAGYDKNGEPRLFETDPSGAMLEYKATAIGKNENNAIGFMEGAYNDEMDLEDGIIMALLALHDSHESRFRSNIIEIGIIEENDKMFRKLSIDEIEKYSDMVEEIILKEDKNESSSI